MHDDAPSADRVLRLRVELSGVTPPIWREIEVPAGYDFWSLHVAIQDAMGWEDSHLHEFVLDPKSGEADSLIIGLPDPDAPDTGARPGWDYPIAPFVHQGAPAVEYRYDFGDGWEHLITCVAERNRSDPDEVLPRCVAGERACPPEDCGGPPGYEQLLQALRDPENPEHRDILEWLGGDFDPQAFDPQAFDLGAVNRALWRLK